MRPENPFDSSPLVQLLSDNLILIAVGVLVFGLIVKWLLGLGNGPSSGYGGSGGGGDWGGGGGDGGGGGE
ncbi:MAG: hypothetical protein AAFU41_11350 [Pseudomonadota bacterium]